MPVKMNMRLTSYMIDLRVVYKYIYAVQCNVQTTVNISVYNNTHQTYSEEERHTHTAKEKYSRMSVRRI